MGWGSIKKKKKMGKGGLLTPVSASAPPKVDVVDNGVEETTPLLTQPMQLPSVTAVPIGGDVKVTTMVTTTGVTEIFEEDCVGWLFSLLLNVAWIVFGGGDRAISGGGGFSGGGRNGRQFSFLLNS